METFQDKSSKPPPSPQWGLALSGGGSRAIAFHLGCFRALNETGLLSKINVIFSISGGSVIAALYAYTEGDFDAFDAKTVELLKTGLVRRLLFRFIFGLRFMLTIPYFLMVVIFALPIWIVNKIGHLFGAEQIVKHFVRRRYNRTKVLQEVLDDIFEGKKITEIAKPNLTVVINAAELARGNAFRFSNTQSSSSKLGHIAKNNVPVSLAVAASAAYPMFLPPLYETFNFVPRGSADTSAQPHEVVLTDGGIYDNLGLTCLYPDRNSDFTQHVYPCTHIIACSAGHGAFDGDVAPTWWLTRVYHALNLNFKRSEDTMKDLMFKAYQGTGKCKFIMPYLGQNDKKIGNKPSDYISRNMVKNYGTHFFALKEKDIEILATRGYQQTMCLLQEHWQDELINPIS